MREGWSGVGAAIDGQIRSGDVRRLRASDERHQRGNIVNMPVTVERRVGPEGIITRLRRYYIDESRILMKWQYFCGFIVPAGLLFLFPELSLVRYDWPCTMHTHNEKDIGEN